MNNMMQTASSRGAEGAVAISLMRLLRPHVGLAMTPFMTIKDALKGVPAMTYLRILMCAAVIAAGTPTDAAALGLAARFGEVVVENAQIGQTYNLREVLKLPFGIENRSNAEVEVVVEFEIPNEKTLNEEYIAIPDPNWLRALPARMKIGPRSQGFFDLLLSIPDDPTLNGKHIQANVVAKTVGTGLFGVGIENKLRFSIGPGPETLQEEKRQKAMAKLDFDVSPQALYLSDVPVGTRFDAKAEQNKSVRIANYSTDPLAIRLTSEAWDARLSKPADYEAIPDPSWLSFKKSEQEIPGEEIEVFELILTVPDDPKYRGKKYAALIRTGLTTGFWLDAPVRVYFTTK